MSFLALFTDHDLIHFLFPFALSLILGHRLISKGRNNKGNIANIILFIHGLFY